MFERMENKIKHQTASFNKPQRKKREKEKPLDSARLYGEERKTFLSHCPVFSIKLEYGTRIRNGN
jgi:hypothetical protein